MHIIGVSGGQGLSIGECIFASLGFRISSWSVVGEEQVSKATHTSHFPLPFTHRHSHINSHTSWYPHSSQIFLSSSLLVYTRSPPKPSVKSMHLLMSMMRLSITMALRMGSSWVTLMQTAPISLKDVTTCYNWSQTHGSPGYWILMLIRPLRIATVHMTGVCVCVCVGGGKVGVCVVGWRGG